MYSFILSLVVCIVFTAICILNEELRWDSVTVTVISFVLALASGITFFVFACFLISRPFEEKDTMNDYVLCKELLESHATDNVGSAYSVSKLAIEVNRKIMSANTYRQSKWLNWYYSPKIAELPLLPLVADMENPPFDYEE